MTTQKKSTEVKGRGRGKINHPGKIVPPPADETPDEDTVSPLLRAAMKGEQVVFPVPQSEQPDPVHGSKV